VPNGVPVRGPLLERASPSGTWVLGMAALFRPRKGLEVLLEALATLRAEGVPVQLRAVGTFETEAYRRQIDEHVERLGLAAAIDWRGFQQDINRELAAMDLFVLPSLFGEGLPMVVLEAMAAGVPVVATRVTGTPEAIRDGLDGLVVEPGDGAALAGAVKQIVGGGIDWAALRASAHERHAERFSDRRMAADVARIYREVLDARS
jgi:glycosyltransferase involved in cell wall biosynthesis